MPLGRGLDTLIPRRSSQGSTPQGSISQGNLSQGSSAPAQISSGSTRDIAIDLIKVNPNQPRRDFASEQLDTLKASIKQHGLLQPIVVTPQDGGTYLLIAGERRLRSVKSLGWTTVPAVIKETKANDRAQHLELGLVENLQRENLNPIEEALAYVRLQDEFDWTQDQIAERVKKDRATIANTIRLLKLPAEIQQALRDGKLSSGHARTLIGIQDPSRQAAVFHQIVDGKLSVREAESIVQGISVRPHVRKRSGMVDGQLADWAEQLQGKFKTKVRLTRTRKGGRVLIEAFTPDEFRSVVQTMLQEQGMPGEESGELPGRDADV